MALLGFMKRIFLPGELHGQRSLAGYSAWGGKEWDTTEQLTHTIAIHTHIHTHTHTCARTHIPQQTFSEGEWADKFGAAALGFFGKPVMLSFSR